MKLFCNGFNLFGQLNVNKSVVESFVTCFEFKVIKQVNINQSYSIINTDKGYLLFTQHNKYDFSSISGKNIVSLTSNDDKIIIIDISGELFECHLKDFSNIKKVFETSSNPLFIKICAGYKIVVGYSREGFVYKIPDKTYCRNSSIKEISCGKEHCLLLDEYGNVYSFGSGSRGQLGHGKLDNESEPQLLECLAGIRIKKIAAGGWHSCAISEDGDLYVWGWNGNGQLCLGREQDEENFVSVMGSPHVVNFPEESLNAVLVACGSRHTIILLDDNKLYGSGWNKYHQLTSKDQENYYHITHLHDFKTHSVVDLQCGPWNSAVLCQ